MIKITIIMTRYRLWGIICWEKAIFERFQEYKGVLSHKKEPNKVRAALISLLDTFVLDTLLCDILLLDTMSLDTLPLDPVLLDTLLLLDNLLLNTLLLDTLPLDTLTLCY